MAAWVGLKNKAVPTDSHVNMLNFMALKAFTLLFQPIDASLCNWEQVIILPLLWQAFQHRTKAHEHLLGLISMDALSTFWHILKGLFDQYYLLCSDHPKMFELKFWFHDFISLLLSTN